MSTFIDKMIHTNLAIVNTIWKHIKNSDHLFQNVFTESKTSQKHTSNLSKSKVFIKFFLITQGTIK